MDSIYCSSATSFVSVLLLSLSSMMKLELPHVNVLSKIDLLSRYSLGILLFALPFSPLDFDFRIFLFEFHIRLFAIVLFLILTIVTLDFNLDFYTEVMDLKYLHQYLDSSTSPKFAKLNKAICDLIEDFSLVSFVPLNIQVCFLLRSSNLIDVHYRRIKTVYINL